MEIPVPPSQIDACTSSINLGYQIANNYTFRPT